jgi:hypothetical protein
MADILIGIMVVPIRASAHAISGLFQPHQEVKTAFSIILLKLVANGLQHIFEKWVERCKK